MGTWRECGAPRGTPNCLRSFLFHKSGVARMLMCTNISQTGVFFSLGVPLFLLVLKGSQKDNHLFGGPTLTRTHPNVSKPFAVHPEKVAAQSSKAPSKGSC